ncbi:PhzF family phenazine biosynthesis isomerase [Microbacterium foliorum]|uniref:PhzF family phenazine biosynthesis isomerase n=1 Tax=Rothia terrae TaxID=396015 RepID=UPI00343E9F5B
MNTKIDTQLVGAFSTDSGIGNPVYVVYDMNQWSPDERQLFTNFVNVSECVFVNGIEESKKSQPTINVNIYNPNGRMKFAGHPLIGTIKSLHDMWGINSGNINTGYLIIPFNYKKKDDGYISELEVPENTSRTYEKSAELCALYDMPYTQLPIYDCGPKHVFIRVHDKRILNEFNPKWESLKEFKDIALNVYYKTDTYIENRMFSPAYGVYEDRATGSAVIPLLKELQKENPSVDSIEVIQGTNRKSGVVMYGRYLPDQNRYVLSGKATKVMSGAVFHGKNI